MKSLTKLFVLPVLLLCSYTVQASYNASEFNSMTMDGEGGQIVRGVMLHPKAKRLDLITKDNPDGRLNIQYDLKHGFKFPASWTTGVYYRVSFIDKIEGSRDPLDIPSGILIGDEGIFYSEGAEIIVYRDTYNMWGITDSRIIKSIKLSPHGVADETFSDGNYSIHIKFYRIKDYAMAYPELKTAIVDFQITQK